MDPAAAPGWLKPNVSSTLCAKYSVVESELVTVWMALRPFGSVKSNRSPFFTAACVVLPAIHVPPLGSTQPTSVPTFRDDPSAAITGTPPGVPAGLADNGAL